MSDNSRLKIVLYWHMHQPEYRDLTSGEYQQPWTYLHTIKDYVDMAAHLEEVPEAKSVFNFAPILLDQIDDYATQVRASLTHDASIQESSLFPIRDPLLAALNASALPVDTEQRLHLVKACMRLNQQRLVDRFPPYQRLAVIARWVTEHPDAMVYLDEQFMVDLLVWYHLAWLGETVRRREHRIKALIEKGMGYTLRDRRTLLEVIGEILTGVIGRYRALLERGQVELSMSPYAHPIVPLLLDLKSARQAMPDATLPLAETYPEGEERARWHVIQGIESFERHFGAVPTGCWPSEGSVSDATLHLLEEFGFRWVASGETVLRNSLHRAGVEGEVDREGGMYRPFRLVGSRLQAFFRSDGLSDLIGFTFSDWHADDAVGHLVHELENIARSCPKPDERVVSIILDGENAWEFYPENGYYFLSALYRRLAESPLLELTTFSRCLADGVPAVELPGLVAGSWVYGTMSTWIGNEDKNRGWDMLVEAKRAFNHAVSSGRLSGELLDAAERQLAICEGSDWFWWFGDYNPAESVRDFDRLYRMHLGNLYQLLGEERPEYLSHAFTHGGGTQEAGGVMRRGSEA